MLTRLEDRGAVIINVDHIRLVETAREGADARIVTLAGEPPRTISVTDELEWIATVLLSA